MSRGSVPGPDFEAGTTNTPRRPFAIYAITTHGVPIAARLAAALPGADLFVPAKLQTLAPQDAKTLPLPFAPLIGEQFFDYDCHIFLVSVGAVVRMIAPHLKSKKVDPAVLCIDDAARFVIALLSGHVGRGNQYTERVAAILGSTPVITTASDVRGTLTVDILGRDLGWTLDDPDHNVTRGCAAVVNEQPVCFIQETGEPDWWPMGKALPPGVSYATDLAAVDPARFDTLLIVSDRRLETDHPAHAEAAVIYRPKSLIVGLGCDKDTPPDLVERGFKHLLAEAGLALASVKALATIDIKADEPAFRRLSERLGLPLLTYPAAVLDVVPGIENPSEVVRKHIGTRAVAEPAALLGAGADKLVLPKQKYSESGCNRSLTLAVARRPFASRPTASMETPHGG